MTLQPWSGPGKRGGLRSPCRDRLRVSTISQFPSPHSSAQWIYHINPLAWTVRAVSINELMSPQWQFPGPPAGGGMTQGEFALSVFGMSTNT